MSAITLFLADTDAQQLQKMLDGSSFSEHDRENRNALEEEIARATVVPASEIPADIVRMYSRVRIMDMRTGEQMVFQIVYPDEANYSAGKISILAPIGTALLGFPAGTEIEWRVPSGVRRLRIEAVEYQGKPVQDCGPKGTSEPAGRNFFRPARENSVGRRPTTLEPLQGRHNRSMHLSEWSIWSES